MFHVSNVANYHSDIKLLILMLPAIALKKVHIFPSCEIITIFSKKNLLSLRKCKTAASACHQI